jgi:hypothetical protein
VVLKLLIRRMALARVIGEPLLMKLSLRRLLERSQSRDRMLVTRTGLNVWTKMRRRFRRRRLQTL